jgi:hypothetical protein
LRRVEYEDVSKIRRPPLRAWIPLFVAALVASPFLLGHGGDPSYSCHGPAIAEVAHPAQEGTPGFRANFFDAGWQCNQDARHLVLLGAIVLFSGAAATFIWRRRLTR